MKQVIVPVRFIGRIEVLVPDTMSHDDSLMLAKKLALARALATVDNPDAPEGEAFEEYEDNCSEEGQLTAGPDWDASSVKSVSGVWKAGRESALRNE